MSEKHTSTGINAKAYCAGWKNGQLEGAEAGEKTAWIRKVLAEVGYDHLPREDKGLIRELISRVTGYSRAQMQRHVAACLKDLASQAPLAGVQSQFPGRTFVHLRGLRLPALLVLLLMMSASSLASPTAGLLFLNGQRKEVLPALTPKMLGLTDAILSGSLGGPANGQAGPAHRGPTPVATASVIATVLPGSDGKNVLQPLAIRREATKPTAAGSIVHVTNVSPVPTRPTQKIIYRAALLPSTSPAAKSTPSSLKAAAAAKASLPTNIMAGSGGGLFASLQRMWDFFFAGNAGDVLTFDGKGPVWRPMGSIPSPQHDISHRRGGGGSPQNTTSSSTTTTVTQTAESGWTDNDIYVYLTTSTDSVGIGTSTPETKLEIIGTASGRTIHAQDLLRSSGTLAIEGAAAFGSTLKLNGITYTFPATDGSASGKVLATNGAGVLTWTTVATSGGAATGSLMTAFDRRYVNAAGDTMTGGLLIESLAAGQSVHTIDSGLLLEVIGTASGRVLHAQDLLRSSGTLAIEGAAAFGSTLKLNGVTYTFPYGDGAASGKVLKTNGAGQLTWSTDSDTGGTGLSMSAGDSRYVNISGDGMTGALAIVNGGHTNPTADSGLLFEVAGAMSGRVIHAHDAITSSGTLRVAGVSLLDGATTIAGAVTLSSTLAVTGNSTFDTNTLFVDSSANKVGIGTTTGLNTELEVIGTASGRILHGHDAITSSGTLRVAGVSLLDGATTIAGAATLTSTLAVTGNSTFDTNTLFVDSSANKVGIGTTTGLNTELEVIGTASGRTVHAQDLLRSSGVLAIEGAAAFGSTLKLNGVTYTFPSADGTANQFLQTNGAGTLSWASAITQSLGDARYVNASGDGMTGALAIVNGGNTVPSADAGLLFEVAGAASGRVIHAHDAFTSSGTLRVAGVTLLDSTATIAGAATLTSTLNVTGNSTFDTNTLFVDSSTNKVGIGTTAGLNTELEVIGTASGRILHGHDAITSSGTLRVAGVSLLDGATTIAGAATLTSTLAVTGNSTFDTNTLFVDSSANKVGIGTTTGLNTELEVIGTASGRILHGHDAITSSGTLRVAGVTLLDGATTIAGAATLSSTLAVTGNATFDTNTLFVDSSANKVGIGTTAGLDTELEVIGTASGRVIHAHDLLRSSGVLAIEGAAAFGSTLKLNGVTYTFPNGDGTASGKVLATNGAGQLTWTTTAGAGITLANADIRYVNVSGDTMTGALTIFKNAGTNTGNTLVVDTKGLVYDATNKRVGIGTAAPDSALEIIGTASGRIFHAQDVLRSSGTLLVEGASKLQGAVTIYKDAGSSTGNTLIVDSKGLVYDASNKRVGVGTASPSALLHLVGGAGLLRLQGSSSQTTQDFYNSAGTLQGVIGWTTTGVFNSEIEGMKIRSETNMGLQFGVLNTPLITITSGNRIGLGSLASAPGSPLSVSGSTVISTNGNLGSTAADAGIALEVIGTMSGRILHGHDAITSSGTLRVAGVTLLDSTATIAGATTLSSTLAVTGNATFDTNTLFVDSSANKVGIGTTAGLNTELEVIGTASGRILHGHDAITSSGTLRVAGISLLDGATTIAGAATLSSTLAVTGNATFDTNTLFVDASANKVGIGTTAPETELEVIGTASGRVLHAHDLLRSSGVLAIEGAAAFGSTLKLNGVTYTFPNGDGTASGKVLATNGAGQLTWTTTAGAGITLANADIRYVNVSGDTMTGALTIFKNAGTNTGNTLVVDTKGLVYDATNKRVGIGTATPDVALEVVGVASGQILRAANAITSSGTLRVAGVTLLDSTATIAGAATLSSTLAVTGNATFDTNTLFVDSSANKVGIGTTAGLNAELEVIGTASGRILHGHDAITSSGTLRVAGVTLLDSTATIAGAATLSSTLAVTGNSTFDTNTLFVDSSANKVGIGTTTGLNNELEIIGSASGRILHGHDAITSSGSLRVAGISLLDGATTIAGAATLSSTLAVTGNATFDTNTLFVDSSANKVGIGTTAGLDTELEVIGTASGRVIHAHDLLRSSGVLAIEGAAAFGSTLKLNGVTYTFPNGDGTASGKVLKTNGAGQLTWSADNDTGGSGLSFATGDARYVNISGDGMTGALAIVNGGNTVPSADAGLLFEVAGAMSGRVIHAHNAFTSSGTLRVAGVTLLDSTATIAGATTLSSTLAVTGNATFDTNTLFVDASGNKVGIGTTTGLNTELEVIGTASGRILHGHDAITSSGTLRVAGISLLDGATTIAGAATLSSTLAVTGNATFDTNTLFVDSSANKVGIGTTAGLDTELEVIGTASGRVIHAHDLLRSSGVLAIEGAAAFGSTLKLNGVTYTFPNGDGTASGKVLKTNGAGQLTWSADNDTGGSGLSFATGDARYVNISGDGMTGALAIVNGGNTVPSADAGLLFEVAGAMSGRSMRIQDNFNSSGAVVIKKTAGTSTGNTLVVDTRGLVYDATNKRIGMGTTAPKTKLEVMGTMSGSKLWTSTMTGAGLADCDTSGNALQWDETTERFSCASVGLTMVEKNSNETVNNSATLQNDDELLFATSANTAYVVEFVIHYQVQDAASSDIQLGLSAPSGSQLHFQFQQMSATGSVGTNSCFIQRTTDVCYDDNGLTVGAGYEGIIIAHGIIQTSSTTGNFVFRWSQDSAHASNTTVLKNSILRYATLSGSADLAEVYYTKDSSLRAGHIVEFDPSIVFGVKRATASGRVLGIVSTKPAIILGGDVPPSGSPIAIALAGRVPVKVSGENGPIAVGDYVTLSSIPGHAKKAGGGSIVGQALSAFSGTGTGEIIAFIKNFELGGGFEVVAGSGTTLAHLATDHQVVLTAEDTENRSLLVLDSEETDGSQNLFTIISDVGSDENTVFRVTASGSVFADGEFHSTGADYAEYFYTTTPDLKHGEVVCINVLKANTVERCKNRADSNTVGVVSSLEQASFVGNSFAGADGLPVPGTILVGLIGQLKTKVMVESGAEIHPGDPLMPATVPGFATKAVPGASTIGVALEALKDGTGEINILISRRNESPEAEAIDARVATAIAGMQMEDTVLQKVEAAIDQLNVDDDIRAEVLRQFESTQVSARMASLESRFKTASGFTLDEALILNIQERIRALEEAPVALTVSGALNVAGMTTLSAATLDGNLTVGGNARVAQDLSVDGTLTTSSIFVDGDFRTSGTLHAAALDLGSGATIRGGLTIEGPLTVSSVKFLSGAALELRTLIVQESLQLIGELTVRGLAEFFGDVVIGGKLVLNGEQAGYATVPMTGTSVTIRFSSTFESMPVINVTPRGRVGGEWWMENDTQTGFTIRLATPALQEVKFSWTAIGTELPLMASGGTGSSLAATGTIITETGSAISFPVDEKGIPVSGNDAFNACIRHQTLVVDGQDLSCARYHIGPKEWLQPDLQIVFGWDEEAEDPLTLPMGYETFVTSTQSSSSQSSEISSEISSVSSNESSESSSEQYSSSSESSQSSDASDSSESSTSSSGDSSASESSS